tara:strand:- start:15142 stop:15525 length:384 start_codon:yes stop_codon:yes gene_type:complete
MKKKPLPIKEAAKQTELNSNIRTISKPLKIEPITLAFIHRGRKGMNSIEAFYNHSDTCLNSTVSILVHRYGVHFKRTPEKIRNRVGAFSVFTRYSFLTDNDEEQAKSLVNSLRVKRGLAPIEWEACA